MKWPLISPIAYETHSAESFYAYIKSLMNSNASKEVSGVSISKSGEKLTIRMSRSPKVVTRDELTILAKEYELNETELLKIFKKRKIGIDYADNDERKSTELTTTRTKKNAGSKRKKRQDVSENQLLVVERDSRLHEESSVLVDSEPTK